MEAAKIQIPSIVLSDEVLSLDQGAEERKELARKIREACESHGCFLVECSQVPDEEQQRFFAAAREFFDLPDEAKLKYGRKPKPWHGGYIGVNPYSRQESFGVYGVDDAEVRSLADHMWPDGNPSFCEVVHSMKTMMMDVVLTALRLTLEDLGIPEYYEKHAGNVTCLMRGLKYRLLPKNHDTDDNDDDKGDKKKPTEGLRPHVDHSILSVLYDNAIQGLEVLSDDGVWSPVVIPKGALLVLVGDAYEVWSNGRFRAVKHRVTMHGGDKEKYTCALFMLPKDGATMEVPQELVGEGRFPLFRPFVFSEYLAKHIMDPNLDAIKVFAGINVQGAS